jgi:hypothetical protein
LKNLLLRIARAVGLFALARRRVDGRLLILAYHGLAQADEHEWRPKLFMSRETFQRRLACVRRWQVAVRPLGDGLAELERGANAPYAVALTFDDGYQNFADLALPYLETAGAGATARPRGCTRSPSGRRRAGPRRTRSPARSPRTSITRTPIPSSRAISVNT